MFPIPDRQTTSPTTTLFSTSKLRIEIKELRSTTKTDLSLPAGKWDVTTYYTQGVRTYNIVGDLNLNSTTLFELSRLLTSLSGTILNSNINGLKESVLTCADYGDTTPFLGSLSSPETVDGSSTSTPLPAAMVSKASALSSQRLSEEAFVRQKYPTAHLQPTAEEISAVLKGYFSFNDSELETLGFYRSYTNGVLLHPYWPTLKQTECNLTPTS